MTTRDGHLFPAPQDVSNFLARYEMGLRSQRKYHRCGTEL